MKIVTFLSFIMLMLLSFTVIAQEAVEKELIESANKLASEGKSEEALQKCNQVIQLNSKNAWAYNVRGATYYNLQKSELAVQDYSQAIVLSPNYTSAYLNRGLAYNSLGKYDLAIQDLSQAILLEKNAANYNSRGTAYLNQGNNDLALQDFNEAIKLDAKYTYAYVNRSLVYKNKGMYDQGISDATEAIRLSPSYAYAYNSRGYLYELKGQYDNALDDYSEAIRISPKYTRAYLNRGVSYKLKGLYSASIEEFKRAIELEPKNGLIYINLISPLTRVGQFSKAKEYLDKYKAEDPSGHRSYFGNWGAYKSFIDVIIDDLPYSSYASALEKLNAGIMNFAKELDAENKETYIDMLSLKGYVLEKLNRNAEATDAYNQSLVIHPLQPDVKEALAGLTRKQAAVAKSDNTPPLIELISPETARGLSVVSTKNEVQLVGRAKDASGVAEVKINGKPVKPEEDGLFVSGYTLKSGQNDIVISATDKQGNTASKTFIINGTTSVKSEAAPEPVAVVSTGTTFHAIVIGEKDYQDPSIPDLDNPVKDAREFKSILQNSYTFSANNIDTLFNSSREDIMNAIIQKCNSLTANDNLLIFYAGHGIAEKDKFGDVDGYWIPSSAKKGNTATYISADDINKALKRSNSKHILVIADACFSGSFTRELAADASIGVQKQFAVPSRKIMASGNLEPVPDNSRFIYYLKKNLKENKEKYITAKKLFDSFYEAILNNSETSPQYAAIKNVGDEGGEFVFIKK